MGNHKSGRRPDQGRRQLAVTLRRQGLTFQQVARFLGVSRQRAWALVRDAAAVEIGPAAPDPSARYEPTTVVGTGGGEPITEEARGHLLGAPS